jgi:lysyl-tRNA synthetase class 2
MNKKDEKTSQPEISPLPTAQPPLAELIRTRYEKAQQLRAQGINPYPYRYEITCLIQQILDDFDHLVETKRVVRIAGRVMLIRKMGKSIFADVRGSSAKIQVYIKLDQVGQEVFDRFDSLDLGDFVGCEGTLFVTKMGERTLSVNSFEILCKALHPLPDKHAGLTDIEIRYRRRYIDLIANPEVKETFVQRSRITQAVREFLTTQNFLEVETPILQPLYGGASARPFETHHNTLDMKMYLRIADELYLKRLIVGGYDKVWELCKDFRNEGLSRMHNPEFTMVELYWAYADYYDMASLYEELLKHVVFDLHGSYKFKFGEHDIDFEPRFRWMTMLGGIKDATGVDLSTMSYDDALSAAKKLGIKNENNALFNWGKVVAAIFDEKVQPNLIQPTFVADFPAEISPLAKKHRENDRLTERFEFFVATLELGNAFSELNDPVDQLLRFLEQGKALQAGDQEAQPLDDDFITALAYGMPPTAGLGFGIDRMVMLLTNQQSIRDVIFFPQMKDMKDGAVPVSRILSGLIKDATQS